MMSSEEGFEWVRQQHDIFVGNIKWDGVMSIEDQEAVKRMFVFQIKEPTNWRIKVKNRIKQFVYGVTVVVVGNVVYDFLDGFLTKHVGEVESLKDRTAEAAKAAQEAFNDTEGEI